MSKPDLLFASLLDNPFGLKQYYDLIKYYESINKQNEVNALLELIEDRFSKDVTIKHTNSNSE